MPGTEEYKKGVEMHLSSFRRLDVFLRTTDDVLATQTEEEAARNGTTFTILFESRWRKDRATALAMLALISMGMRLPSALKQILDRRAGQYLLEGMTHVMEALLRFEWEKRPDVKILWRQDAWLFTAPPTFPHAVTRPPDSDELEGTDIEMAAD